MLLYEVAGTPFSEYFSNYITNSDDYLKWILVQRHIELDLSLELCLQKFKHINILDLGCGTGLISIFLSNKLGDKAKVTGIDIKDIRLNSAHALKSQFEKVFNRKLHCDFINTSILDIDPNQKYDLIWIEEGLHHMEPRKTVIKKIERILNTNGLLVLSETNGLNMLVQACLIIKRGFGTLKIYTDNDGTEHLYGDERIFSAAMAKRWFKNIGLIAIKERHFKYFPPRYINMIQYISLQHKRSFESILGKMPLLNKYLSLNYNIIFRKQGLI